jgi:hypothetical protein
MVEATEKITEAGSTARQSRNQNVEIEHYLG